MKLTLEELDSIYDEAIKKVEDNPIYTEIYQNGILCGMRKLRTAIEVRLRSKGIIQDIVDAGKAKNIDNLETFSKWARSFDCDFDVKIGKKCETGTFDGVIGVHERTIDDDIKEIKKYFSNDWLWLPISREWLNLKNVRKITKREGMRGKDNKYFSVVVIYIDGNYEEYYCRDAKTIVELIGGEQVIGDNL